MRIDLRITGVRQADARLGRVADAVSDARPAWDELADRFAAANAAGWGRGWAPLARPTGRPPLVATGTLRASLTSRPLGVERITKQSMTIGTNVLSAHFHAAGTSRMPRRPIIDSTARRGWGDLIRRYIGKGAR